MSTYRSTATVPQGRRPRGPVAARNPISDPAAPQVEDPNGGPDRPAHLSSLTPADGPGTEGASTVMEQTFPETPVPQEPQPPAADPPPTGVATNTEVATQKRLVVVQGGVIQHAAEGIHVLDLDDAAEITDPYELLDLLIKLTEVVGKGHARDDAANALLSLIRERV